MVCLLELSLLELNSSDYPGALDCQVSTSSSHSVRLDKAPVQVSLRSARTPFIIQLVAGGATLASVPTSAEELLQGSCESCKTFTFSVEGLSQLVQARLSLKLLTSPSCQRCEILEQTVKDLQEELSALLSPGTDEDAVSDSTSVSTLAKTASQQPDIDKYLKEENAQLKSLLEKSYEARREIQQLIRETTEQMNEEIRRLNKRVQELCTQNNTLNQAVTSKCSQVTRLELDLDESHSRNELLKKEVERLKPVSAFVVEPVDLDGFSKKVEEYDKLLNKLTEDKAVLSNEVLRLKGELADKGCAKPELLTLKHQIAMLKQRNTDLGRANENLTAELAQAQAKLASVNTRYDELKENYDELYTLFQNNAATRDDLQLAYESLQEIQLSKEKELTQKEAELEQVTKERLDLQSKLMTLRQSIEQSSHIKELRAEIERAHQVAQEKLDLHTEELESSRMLARQLTAKVADLQASLAEKTNELDTLELERDEALAELTKMEQYLCVNEDLNQMIDDLKSQNSAYQSANDKLAQELSSMSDIILVQSKRNQASSTKLKKLATQLNKKEQELMRMKLRTSQTKEQGAYFPCPDDPVDIALAEYINNHHPKAAALLKREDPGIYTYGSKRIFVKVEQGKLLVRVRGSCMPIERFLEVYNTTEMEKLQSKTRLQRHTVGSRPHEGPVLSASGDLTPKQAAKAVREQILQGKFTMMYAGQCRPATPTQPKEVHRTKRTNSLRKLSDTQ